MDGGRPEDPYADRPLAGADVDLVRTPPGHVVVKGAEDLQRGVNGRGGSPLAGPDKGVAPQDPVVAHPGQVDGQSVSRADLGQGSLMILEGPDPHSRPSPSIKQHQVIIDVERAA